MTFDDHLRRHRRDDGSYDLRSAEESLYEELAASPDALDDLARMAASKERRSWESSNRERLAAQFKARQGEFSFDVDLDAKVPLGDNTVVALRDMNRERIQTRKDLRTRKHLDEADAYGREMSFWFGAEAVLRPGETIGDLATGED